MRNQGGVAVGNVLGSNVMNILGILGTASVIGEESKSPRICWARYMGSYPNFSLVAAMLLDDREIGPRVGATMVIGYLAYMSFLYYSTTLVEEYIFNVLALTAKAGRPVAASWLSSHCPRSRRCFVS